MLPRSLASACRAVALVVAALATSSAGSHAATPDRALAPVVETLPNGMKIAVIEDHAMPVVQTAVWYRFGAGDERPGQHGLAHALAHVMFGGTPSLSAAGLDDLVSRLGAKETATTANDYTVYRFVLPADKLRLALRVEADRMAHLDFDDATWAREKAELLAEYDADAAQPLTHLYENVCAAASSAPVCSLAALGSRADIASATVQDLRGDDQSRSVPAAATLVITGDVVAADALRWARDAFGTYPKSDVPTADPTAPFFNAERQVEIAGDFPYEVVELAFPVPGTGDAGDAAIEIVDAIVNNRRSDFHKALVRSGYTIGYTTQLDRNVRGGLLHVFLVTAPGHSSKQARDAFAGVMASAVQNGFPSDLVASAKAALARRTTYARDSISGVGDRLGYALAVDPAADPAARDARIAAVTAADLTSVARRFLTTPAVTGLLQPGQSKTGETPRPPVSSVTDDFAGRAPAGRVVQARWARQALIAPSGLRSRVRPQAFVLRNGLRVLVQESHANPTFFLNGTIATSPAFDPPGREGAGAMVSSLLDYGSARYDFDAQHAVADRAGASVDFGLNFDAHGRTADLPAILDVLADDVEHPAFTPSYVDFVRKQTLGAVRERDADPGYRSDRDFDALLLRPDDPTLREPSAVSVAAIGGADLEAYARRYLRPDTTTLSIVGDVDPATLRAQLERAFGGWNATGERPSLDPGPVPPPHAAQRYVVTGGRTISARLGESAPNAPSAAHDAVELLSTILGAGGGYDTRLGQDLRVVRHLALAASTSYDADRYRGTLSVRLVARPEDMAASSRIVRWEFARLKRDPIGPFELDRAKNKIVAAGVVAEESTAIVAARVQTIGRSGLALGDEERRPARFAKIDGAVMLDAARRYLHEGALVEVDEGPRP